MIKSLRHKLGKFVTNIKTYPRSFKNPENDLNRLLINNELNDQEEGINRELEILNVVNTNSFNNMIGK